MPDVPRTKKGRQQRVGEWSWTSRKDKLREVCRREGRYLLRTNLAESDPAKVWGL